MKPAAPILAALLLAGCGNAPADDVEQDVPGIGANGRRDLAGIGLRLPKRLQGSTYYEYDATRDHDGTGLAFAGYGCMSNCADMMQGYQHAARLKLRAAEQCTGDSWGHIEGCVAFTQGAASELSTLPPLKK